jgi:hypothetical protein
MGEGKKMKMSNRMKLAAAAMFAAALTIGTSASAAVVTQLIHFDDFSSSKHNPSYYTADTNFKFSPVNGQSGNCAASTVGGNGSCVIETSQGVIGDLTRPANPEGVPVGTDYKANDPLVPTTNTDKIFSLVGFYFQLDGKGSDPNFIKAESFLGGVSKGSVTFAR